MLVRIRVHESIRIAGCKSGWEGKKEFGVTRMRLGEDLRRVGLEEFDKIVSVIEVSFFEDAEPVPSCCFCSFRDVVHSFE